MLVGAVLRRLNHILQAERLDILTFYLTYPVLVDSPAVLADVQTDGIDRTWVVGETDGIILRKDLVGGLRGGLTVFQLEDVDGVLQLQSDVHPPVTGHVLCLNVGTEPQ